MDIGSAGPSLPRRDSSLAWCAELYSIRPGHKIPIGILVEVEKGIWDTSTLQYSLSPSHG